MSKGEAPVSDDANERYVNQGQQLLMAVEEALLADPQRPKTRAALSEAVGTSRYQTYSALVNLEMRGRAVRAGSGWVAGQGLFCLALAGAHRHYLKGE